MNNITKIDRKQLNIVLNTLDRNTYLVTLDGEKISSTKDLFDEISKQFNFEYEDVSWGYNWYAFDDLMTDLNWIDNDQIVMIISSYDLFMRDDINEKNRFLNYMSNSIIPFWENQAEENIVQGQRKSFTVYCVI